MMGTTENGHIRNDDDPRIDVPADEKAAAQEQQAAPEAIMQEPVRNKYPTWIDLLAIVGVFLGAGFFSGLVKMLLDRVTVWPHEATMCIAYFLQMTLVLLFILWQRRTHGVQGGALSFSTKGFHPMLILWGIVLVLATSVVIEPLLALFPQENMELLKQSVGRGGWTILMTVVLAPVFEEMIFRGAILESIRRRSGALAAVVISALIFGLVHLIPQQVVNAFFIGLILGYIYIRTHSLLPVIVIHAVNNMIAYIGMGVEGEQMETLRQMITNDTWYYIVYGLCVVIFAVSFIAMTYRLGDRTAHADEVAVQDNK